MAYQDQQRRPRSRSGSSRTGSSTRQYTGAARARVPTSGVYHGPTGTRTRPKATSLRGGGRNGYPLRSRSINFQGNRNRVLGVDRRVLILGALAVVLVVLVIAGVTACVRGCSSTSGDASQADSRVAAGLSEELTSAFTEELDQGEKLATIAENADQYEDQGLLELALSVPEAIDFVEAYPSAERTAQPYEDEVTQGTAPQLWCWDSRWGNVDYAGRAIAITGSGPTALSMAYMGLTGSSDLTPADVAEAATEAGAATGDSAMTGEFLAAEAEELGLSCESYVSNGDTLAEMLDSGTYVLMETAAGSLTNSAHWVLVVTENEDGSMVVYDPTSPDVSAHPWAPATLASTCTEFYVLSLPGTDDDDSATSDDDATDATGQTDSTYD